MPKRRSREMLAACCAVLLPVLVAACGASQSQSKPKQTGNSVYRVGTIPALKGKHGKVPQAPKNGPSSKNVRQATVKPLPTHTALPAQAFTVKLHGAVKDAKTRSPIAGAIVITDINPQRTTKTDAFGRYNLSLPGKIAVPIRVIKTGYAGQVGMGTLKAHSSYTLDFSLSRITPGKPTAPPPPIMFGSHP